MTCNVVGIFRQQHKERYPPEPRQDTIPGRSSQPQSLLSGIAPTGALREGLNWLPTSFPLAAAAVAAVILAIFINTLATPKRADPREPPLLTPTIPFIGHIIGLIRYQADYHRILYCKSKQPIVTLPMLNGKLYVIFDPSLISAGLKNKYLSTKP